MVEIFVKLLNDPEFVIWSMILQVLVTAIMCVTLIVIAVLLWKLVKGNKNAKTVAMVQTSTPEVTSAPVTNTDDTQLVAVIAAAIAAYEGTSTDDFVVRSIRRR